MIVAEMIVFNEEEVIKYSLGSIYNFVDYIVIVDAYSTDKTIEIIKSLDVNKKITILQRKWDNDYAAQRNVCLNFIRDAFCPNDNLWVMRVDADEVYYQERLAGIKIDNSVNGYRFNFLTFEGSYETLSEKNPIESRVCLYKFNNDIRYIGKIHEMPMRQNNNPVYTHNLADDSGLGITHLNDIFYCHFSWCSVDRCKTKARNYTETYVKQGKETQERLDSIDNGWWWAGHESDNKFTGKYPEKIVEMGLPK